jgi:hypothetical protein
VERRRQGTEANGCLSEPIEHGETPRRPTRRGDIGYWLPKGSDIDPCPTIFLVSTLKLRPTGRDGRVSQVAGFFGCGGDSHLADFGLALETRELFDRK